MSKANRWAERFSEADKEREEAEIARPDYTMSGGNIRVTVMDSGMPKIMISALARGRDVDEPIEFRPTVEAIVRLAEWILDMFERDLPDPGAVGEP